MAADHIFGDSEDESLYRFFGDDDGDRDVDGDDLTAFAVTFRFDTSSPAYNSAYDLDGDGDVDADDLTGFAQRFRSALPF